MQLSWSWVYRQVCPDVQAHYYGLNLPAHTCVFQKRSFKVRECFACVVKGTHCPGLSLQRLGASLVRVSQRVTSATLGQSEWLGSLSGVCPLKNELNLWGCWFSRFWGALRLLARRGAGPGQWMQAAPGDHIS